ncbi:gamma-glutamyl-gamma-aminobutyrate hydrolase family protein [Enterococcus sp. N342-3-1-2]
MKPIIGIAANERSMIEESEHWLTYTPKNFVTHIQEAGGLPLLLPMGALEDAKTYVKQIDKLLLAGGHDVSPSYYGETLHPLIQGTHPERDAFELALIKEAVAQKKPIFGVCRGMQLINVAFGGSLYQDLSLMEKPTLKHVQLPTPFRFATHDVTINSDSQLGQLLGSSYQVNSFHHQAVKDVAKDFQIIATAPDGVVEAIESHAFAAPVLGIQWHPELAAQSRPSEQAIFEFFVHTL